MGGAPGSIALLALCAAIGCVVAPGCRSATEGAAPSHAAPRDVEAHAADDAGGAPGASAAGASTMPPSSKQPPLEAGQGGAAGGAGEPPAEGDAGEPGAAGASTVIVAPRPSCGKQEEGVLCGGNMTPAGIDAMRYFCSGGEVLAEARCPAACNVETNACEQSGGTGSGSGETQLYTAVRCPKCYATVCRAELMACQASPRCVAHLSCVESCSIENGCFAICDSAFEDELLFRDLDKCAEQTGCAALCHAEEQP